MEFEYTTHDRTGAKLPKASEELVETLEDNQVWVLQKKYQLSQGNSRKESLPTSNDMEFNLAYFNKYIIYYNKLNI